MFYVGRWSVRLADETFCFGVEAVRQQVVGNAGVRRQGAPERRKGVHQQSHHVYPTDLRHQPGVQGVLTSTQATVLPLLRRATPTQAQVAI